ncbi:uncharacterized protein [Watersipora subatra]|uniref:uncharacterized protein n=1 Tax=Watersipora subatra TaxID=2589382 RepID=UPI00355C0BE9
MSCQIFVSLTVLLSLLSNISVSALCTDSEPINKVHIVGLLEINPSAQCHLSEPPETYGLSLALAVEYILDLVNSSGADIAVPGVEYEFKLEDICLNRSLATRTAALSIPKTLWTEQNVCFHPRPVEEQQNSLLLGFVGPTYSSNAKYVAEFLNNTNIPVISPAATLAKLKDPYLHNSFLRTVPSDSKQSKAMVKVALKLEWSYILLIHTNDDYGRDGAKAIQEHGRANGICFSNVIEVDLDPANPRRYYESIGRLMKADSAKGIIYFGFLFPATAIIESYFDLASGSSGMQKIILASEGVGITPEILETLRLGNGELGLIVMSPYNQANTLRSYIEKRIDGTKSGTPETTSLIRRFVEECNNRYQCSNEVLINATVSTQPTIEAVVSILHAFKEVHDEMCAGVAGICSQLSESPMFYSAMLKSLLSKNEQVEIGEVVVSVAFDEVGELDSSTAVPAYTLNTAVRGSDNIWRFVEVGQFAHNEKWSYSNEGLITTYSESRCLSNCEFCEKLNTPYLYRRNENSRYIIAGTGITSGDLNEHDCGKTIQPHGFLMMEAFYYTVKQIEEITGLQFSTLFIDTCYAKLGTHALMNDIFREADTAYLKDMNGKEWSIKPRDFIVFLSGSSSGVTLALQTYLNVYEIPQISFRATTVWLSDPLRYPLFLRNVPSDEQQAKAMIQIVKKNGWKEIGLITSESVYGQTGGYSVEQFASDNGICITYRNQANNLHENIRDLAISIRQTAENNQFPRVVIIFAENQFIANFLQQIKLHDPKWSERGNILLGSETWGTLKSVTENAEELVYGSLTFSFSNSTYSWTTDGTNYFQKYLDTQNPTNNKDNPLFLRFWQEYFNCYLLQNSFSTALKKCDDSLSLGYTETVSKRLDYEESSSKYLILAGLSVAYSIKVAAYVDGKCKLELGILNCSQLFDTPAGRNTFFQYLKQTKVPQKANSISRTYLPFTETGEGKANYDVYNIIKKTDGTKDVAAYNPIYNIEDGELQKKAEAQFYVDGIVSTAYSECKKDCVCLNSIKLDSDMTSADFAYQCKTDSSVTLLIVLLVIMILLLITCIAHIVLQRRQHQNLKQILFHDIPRSPAPIPLPPLGIKERSQKFSALSSRTTPLSRNPSYVEPQSVERFMNASLNVGMQRSRQPKSTYIPAISLSPPDGEHLDSLGHYETPDSVLSQGLDNAGASQQDTLPLTSSLINSELKPDALRNSVVDAVPEKIE